MCDKDHDGIKLIAQHCSALYNLKLLSSISMTQHILFLRMFSTQDVVSVMWLFSGVIGEKAQMTVQIHSAKYITPRTCLPDFLTSSSDWLRTGVNSGWSTG